MTRLFIGTLKGVTFEWFMKLPIGSIKTWADLEKLFLARFFEDNTEIFVPTLLATKQKKGESIKTFIENFWSMTLRCPSGMTPVYVGRDMPSQFANFPTHSNGSSRMSHLEAVGATRRIGGRNYCQGYG